MVSTCHASRRAPASVFASPAPRTRTGCTATPPGRTPCRLLPGVSPPGPAAPASVHRPRTSSASPDRT
eukprot:8722733-Heterocapsa_arctica.AAC.1